jgi:hypothetical protein
VSTVAVSATAEGTATMTAEDKPDERPDLTAWKRRHGLRSSSAAQPKPSGTEYKRKPKHKQEKARRDGS